MYKTTKPITVSLFGTGYFGRIHLNAWQRVEGVKVTSIVDPSKQQREEIAKSFPGIQCYSSTREFASAPLPDIIDIASPPDTHLELISEFSGKAETIICQKPFCADMNRARQAIALAEEKQTRLIVHENFRFMPWYRAIKAEIDSGTLGSVRQARFSFRPGDGNGPDAYQDRQPYFARMRKFLVHETAVHWIDVFRYLFGEPSSVYADLWQSNPEIAGEDSGILILDFPPDIKVLFEGNRTLDHPAENHRLTMGEMLIEGSKATLKLTGDGHIHVRNFASNSWRQLTCDFQLGDFGGDCVYHFQSHVLDCLRGQASFETLAHDYLRNIVIENLIYESDNKKQRVEIP